MTSFVKQRHWSRLAQHVTAVGLLAALFACASPPVTEPNPAEPVKPVAPQVDGGSGIVLKPVTNPIAVGGAVVTANEEMPPAAPREFRAAWVSTVANIDWPSRRDLSTEKQQAEIIQILDTAAQLKLNALILQVRPSGDAIYPSTLEPWSEFLTGEQGRAPNPFYDPLQFWIEQAHKRGIQLHAWFNPYRARTPSMRTPYAATHIAKRAPQVVRTYGDLQWMDPAEPLAAQNTLAVIRDVVQRYDIDGVHIDDYFYPYPIKNSAGAEVDFPDANAWRAYQQSGGALSRADWRRQQVNHLVETIYVNVHQIKPWVKFGISPFGIGRPDRLPNGITGFSQFDKLYADVELWLQNGWLDYLVPQLYWPITQTAQAFPVLNNYWHAQNPLQRPIWPGLYTSKIDNSEASWSSDEILKQVDISRNNPNAGHSHFSFIPLAQDRKQVRSRLAAEKYITTALVPSFPWLNPQGLVTPRPTLNYVRDQKQIRLSWENNATSVVQVAVWKRSDLGWQFSVQDATQTVIVVDADSKGNRIKQVVVSSVNRYGEESARSSVTIE
ncbi:family 10 glycosylhydrolase [Undibacterium sp. LX40W]|uniref:Family 10 glycosylhydrolase n=1 Tax=Undibacterium nitidum TaxID=2762298 RepID=A0A923KTS1_9BURK|nr:MULTISPECIES: family 10 glycosylhydrolase [Undibacterium]MBC3881522.1 family 10 glycosylhydrolase [Undibacterium nitidum]MBC3891696.1 family 10 glycosylhydrolase [Undibacterium sp. LX40W]